MEIKEDLNFKSILTITRQTTIPSAAMSSENVCIAWIKDTLDRYVVYRVNAQLFDNHGNRIGDKFQVNDHTEEYYESTGRHNPSIAMSPTGKSVIAWQNYKQREQRDDIFAQLLDNNGNKIGSEFQVNSYTKDNQTLPSVAMSPEGNFVVTWESWGQDGYGQGIYAQLFDPNGNKVGNEFQVNNHTEYGQTSPSVAISSNRDFLIAWEDVNLDGGSREIYSQLFDQYGNRIGNEFLVNTTTEGSQEGPAVTASNDDFVVAWQSSNQDGDSWGIYAQRFKIERTDIAPPILTSLNPPKGVDNINPNTDIYLEIKDPSGINQNSLELLVNGVKIEPFIRQIEEGIALLYDPPTDFQNGETVNIQVRASDLAGNLIEEEYLFRVAPTTSPSVPPGSSQVPATHVDDDNTTGIEDGTLEHPFNTIQEGVDAVVEGGTVRVASGYYPERISAIKSLSLTGEDPHSTIVSAISASNQEEAFILALLDGQHLVNGFTFQSPSGSHIGLYSHTNADIENNIFLGNNQGVYITSGGDVSIINNTFYENGTAIMVLGRPDQSAKAIIKNNELVGGRIFGAIRANPFSSITFQYNCLYNNGSNFFDFTPSDSDIGNIFEDPLFVDADNIGNRDFHLQPNSPCIDAGDPSILDTDGSRSDMGAFGGSGTAIPVPSINALVEMIIDNAYTFRVVQNQSDNTLNFSVAVSDEIAAGSFGLMKESGIFLPTTASINPRNVRMYCLGESSISWQTLGSNEQDPSLLSAFYEAYKAFVPAVGTIGGLMEKLQLFFDFVDSGREDIVRPRYLDVNSNDFINFNIPSGSFPILTKGLMFEFPVVDNHGFFFKYKAGPTPTGIPQKQMTYGIEFAEGQSPIITKQGENFLFYQSGDGTISVEYHQVTPGSSYVIGESGTITLELPAFSLSKALTLKLEKLQEDVAPFLEGIVGYTYMISPPDVRFLEPFPTLNMSHSTSRARISKPAQGIETKRIFYYDVGSGSWTPLESRVQEDMASANIAGGGIYAVGILREEIQESEASLELLQNYPNPFYQTTTIRYLLSGTASAQLDIYNALGQKVRTIEIDNQFPGIYSTQFDGRDSDDNRLSPGIYFYRSICGNDVSQAKKMLLLRPN